MKHPDDEVFAAFAFGDLPAPERAEVEGHMRDCESCRNSLVNIAEIESLLADESLFTLADAMNARAETPLSLAQFALDLERERTEARELVGHALDSPVDFVAAKVAKQERFARVEVVRLLIRRSAEILQDDPKFALLVSSAAVQLAGTLARSRDRFDYSLLGTALKERATGLRFTGRHAEALDVLERAERAFKSDPKTLPYDLAVVWVNRAAVLAESDRADDAAKLARSAAAILREFGDTTHAASARMIEASGFYFSGRPHLALPIFEGVASDARKDGNQKILAAALQNAGCAHRELGNFDSAAACHAEALAIYDEIGHASQRARVRFALASLLVPRGEFREAIPALAAAREELTRLGMTNEANIAALRSAAAHLALGMTEAVEPLTRDLVFTFASEGMIRNSRIALAYLNEALASKRATPAIIEFVREYLEYLPARPSRPFVSPA